MITALLVGLGAVGQRHARNLRTLLGSNVRLIAFRTTRQAPALDERLEVLSGQTVEELYGIKSFDDLSDALHEHPTVAFICNPTSLHVPVARMAAAAGAHLFIEKPLSHTLDGVAELAGLVEARGLVAAVGYQMRFHPSLLRLRSLLEQRAVGRLLAVDIVFSEHLPHWHRYEEYRQSYAARRALGGGVLLTQIHDLDYAQWLFGMPRRLFAIGGRFSGLDVDVEDSANLLLECDADGRALPVHVHQDFVRRQRTRACRVMGDEGTITVDLIDYSVEVLDAEGRSRERHVEPAFERNQLFLDELRNFIDAVDGRERPSVSLQDSLSSLRMALAAQASIENGQAVMLS